jgi:DNA polymerase III subunit delta'
MAWAEVRGHAHQADQLRQAQRAGRLGHAYLCVGPEGIGKKRFATELAKTLLCEKPPTPFDACDRCPACAQVMANTHPDFVTAQKPEDRIEFTIETMRELLVKLSLRPVRGTRKVTVIEDVDDFNEETANCFLKTLEEPPPGSMFLLLATSAERQLATIISRSQVLKFNTLGEADLRAILAEQELVTDNIEPIIALSAGRVGRAVALADEAVWNCREKIIGHLGSTKPSALELAQLLTATVEEAGKESPVQRERAVLLIQLVGDILRDALRAKQGVFGNTAVYSKADAIARRWSEEVLCESMDATVEAERLIQRRVPVPVVLEQLADRLLPAG